MIKSKIFVAMPKSIYNLTFPTNFQACLMENTWHALIDKPQCGKLCIDNSSQNDKLLMQYLKLVL
jgi:hypothetical protein